MKNIQRRWDPAVCWLFCGVQFLLPLASVTLFQRRFDYGTGIIFYHLLIVGLTYGLLLGGTAALGALRPLRGMRATRYLLPLAWGGLAVGLYYTYLLAWGGRLTNGMNLRFSWVAPYVLHPSMAINTLSVPPAVFWGVLVGVPLIILAAYAAAARSFAAVELRWLARLRHAWTGTPLQKGVAAGGLVLVGLALAGVVNAAADHGTDDHPKDYLFDDPIFISLFKEDNALPLAGVGNPEEARGKDYPAPTQFQRKNVILIVVDACRADHLSALGYRRETSPFLGALKDSGHLRVVRSFYSASCCTFGGILTILRSHHWFNMTLHGFALHDVLKRMGYHVHFLLGGDHTNYASLKSIYGHNVDSFSDGQDKSRHFALNDDRGVFESLGKLAAYDGTPAFLYLHLMSVHGLGVRLSSSDVYKPHLGKWNPETYTNNYDNGVIQADRNIYEVFRELKRKGYLQNSLVVITGDHGESLGERGFFGHAQNLYAEEIQPPLLIYDPEPVAYRNLEFARQVDIAPTILDRLGLPIPSGWDGRSLLRETPRFAYLRFGDTYAIVDHGPERTLKYLFDARAQKEEVYDDTQDPTEQRDILANVDPQELQALRQALLAFAPKSGTEVALTAAH